VIESSDDGTAARGKSDPGPGAITPLASLPLVIHERLGNWARHLRPRLSAWPVRVVESRSTADLESALSRAACPIVVIDLACGEGYYSRLAKLRGPRRALGVDLSAKMIELARAQEASHPLEVEHAVGDCGALELPE